MGTKLILGMVCFVLVLLIIPASMIVIDQRIAGLNKQIDLAADIELKAGELGYLSDDYLLYHEGRQIELWNSKYASISSDISNLILYRPQQQSLANDIRSDRQQLKEVFDDVVSKIDDAPQTRLNTIDPAFSRESCL